MMVHWTQRRKAGIVDNVAAGNLTFEAACDLYALSPEELGSWIDRRSRGKTLKATIRVRAAA